MQGKFEMPTAEIIVFGTEDVITTSFGASTEEAELPKVDF